MTKKLNLTELCIYLSVYITVNIYCLFKLFRAQSELLKINHESEWRDLVPGWAFLSRYRDVSDFEWQSWKHFFRKSWYYLMFQFLMSEMIRVINKAYLKYWYILSSVIFITTFMGLKQMILIAVQPLTYLMTIFVGGGKISVWFLSIVFLLIYNELKHIDIFWHIFNTNQTEDAYVLLLCIGWVALRCISFCIDFTDKRDKLEETEKKTEINKIVTNMLNYVLYLPILYTGPIVIYEDFERSFHIKGDGIMERLCRFAWDMLLFLIYTFMLDLAYHYIYFYAMQYEIKIIAEFSAIELCGGGFWVGVRFYLKYVILYGTTSAFARLDNVEAPPTPRCVARIHLYSQMWKYFDVGLYKFLVKYIYQPSLSTISRSLDLPIMAHKLAASFITFLFTFTWHGTTWDIFIWSALNFLGITFEHSGKVLSTSDLYKWFKREILKSDEMEVRFLAFVCTPLLTMSLISSFYLISGSDLGNMYFKCFLCPFSWNLVIVTVLLYCYCHISIALQHIPSRTDVKKHYIRCKAE